MFEIANDLGLAKWIVFGLGAAMFGASKTGMFGVNMLGIAIFAILFGGKDSTGILLPILCVADLVAVLLYRRQAQWDHIWRLMPWTILGLLFGVWIGDRIDDGLFKITMSAIILISVFVILANEWLSKKSLPKSWWLVAGVGLVAGFTTMVGNAAGAALTLYLLAMRISKAQFIGTIAWYFLIVNWVKVPFHVVIWDTITIETLVLDLLVVPFILLGSLVGLWITRKISEELYRSLLIAMTVLAAIAIVI